MCSRTTCFNCKRPTWSGCGNHIEIALSGVPKSQRCKCTKAELAAAKEAKKAKGSFFSKIFGGK